MINRHFKLKNINWSFNPLTNLTKYYEQKEKISPYLNLESSIKKTYYCIIILNEKTLVY